MPADALHRALTDPGEPPVRPLPDRAAALTRRVACPPRLAAHLRLVHDVAHELTGWLAERYPAVACDREAVLFGAATHDIGKSVHVAELTGSGHAHERAGHQLLLDHGVGEDLARFARTHGSWDAGRDTEDLVVSTADKVWKGKRVPDLERLLVDRVAAAGRQEPWEAFLALDDLLDHLATGAERRLAFQNSHPVVAGGS